MVERTDLGDMTYTSIADTDASVEVWALEVSCAFCGKPVLLELSAAVMENVIENGHDERVVCDECAAKVGAA